ncbi:hypothetical protein TruAng_009356 [Truncatella angustata]|nr:hypothetical protein TruAng_009356 [Truncatella angustata]
MAAVQVQVSNTPSPPPRVRTPQTPKFGAFGDSWMPYSPPRKSARIANRTPSPYSSTTSASRDTTSRKSTFSTPATSPQKKRAPAMDSVIRASRASHASSSRADSARHAADLLTIGPSKPHQKSTAAMLPTPAKTPRKQPDDKLEAGVRGIARTLFHGESSTAEAVASPRKRKAKTYSGVSLQSFRAEEVDEEIPIFTDTRDRLPEVDASNDNPFYGNTVENQQPSTSTRRSTRVKKVLVPGMGRIPVDEAVQRGDGIVYVFRGKSFWKPREDGNCGDDEHPAENPEADAEVLVLPSLQRSGSPPRRTTRSSMKPRLLFPRQAKPKVSLETDDEEAATDIEDHVLADNAEPEVQEPEVETPTLEEPAEPDTPSAPRFAPASPPTTARATRVSKRLTADDTPAKRTSRRSPFDAWRRSKSSATTAGHKREADTILQNDGALKRPRA